MYKRPNTNFSNNLKRALERIENKAEKTAFDAMNKIAPILLDKVANNDPAYNNYSGNLNYSYHAIVSKKGRNGTKQAHIYDIKPDSINGHPYGRTGFVEMKRSSRYGKKGELRRVFFITGSKRHPVKFQKKFKEYSVVDKKVDAYGNERVYKRIVKRKINSRRYYRFAKPNEEPRNNYRDRAERNKFRYSQKNNTSQIIIVNSAPYSRGVRKKGYQVLSSTDKNKLKYTAKKIILDDFKKAGFKIR